MFDLRWPPACPRAGLLASCPPKLPQSCCPAGQRPAGNKTDSHSWVCHFKIRDCLWLTVRNMGQHLNWIQVCQQNMQGRLASARMGLGRHKPKECCISGPFGGAFASIPPCTKQRGGTHLRARRCKSHRGDAIAAGNIQQCQLYITPSCWEKLLQPNQYRS